MSALTLPRVSGGLGRGRERLRIAVFALVNVLGLMAFLWPFVLPLAPGVNENHKGDGPLILVTLLICLGGVLFVELGRGGLGPKTVALLGVLGAAMVALRLPGFVAGFSAMFIVVLVAGNAFGPGFGFLLGAVGTFASGLFLGGLGPWLPFQMVAVGWVGAGAGLLPKGSWGVRIGVLAAYGFVVGYLFGAVMNLWSWPFLAGSSAVGWVPGAGAALNLHHYATYYAATSFAWDTFRAVGDAVLVLALGRPLLGALDRAARRMRLDVRGDMNETSAAPIQASDPKGAVMAMPPNMFENTGAFKDEVRVEMDEDEEREEHLHGPDCGHEAVEHDGHTDYIDGEHRHWWNKGRWEKH